jgi:radical SAM superfamily enzyme YgiQ (UPF0313 family)
MRVLFLNPPYPQRHFSRSQRSPAVTKSGTLYFPYWLAHAAAVIDEKTPHDMMFIDSPADDLDLETTLAKVRAYQPDVTVLDTSTASIYTDVQVVEEIKKIVPKSFAMLVGTHVSALPEESLRLSRAVDAIARQEYDYIVRDTVNCLAEGGDIATVKGLTYWDKSGEVRHTPPMPYIEDLDELPFVTPVYKKWLKIENYFNPNALYPMVTIITGRGCPYRCTFCVYPQTLTGHSYRLRSVKNVVDEMELIQKEFPHNKAIFFEDDTLTAEKERTIALSQEIINRGLKISWTCNTRADQDEETLQWMAKSGCRMICTGFEAGNQQVLRNMKKGIKVEMMHKFVREAQKAGIMVHGCFLAGLPGETKETLNETLELAKSLSPDTAQFYPLMIYPGTEAYEYFKNKSQIATGDFSEWVTQDGLHNCVVRTEHLTERELVEWCDHARREFYFRPAYLMYKAKQTIQQPREFKRNVKAAKRAFKFLVRGSFRKGEGQLDQLDGKMPTAAASPLAGGHNNAPTDGCGTEAQSVSVSASFSV